MAETVTKCHMVFRRFLTPSVKVSQNCMKQFEQTGSVEVNRSHVYNSSTWSDWLEENIAAVEASVSEISKISIRKCSQQVIINIKFSEHFEESSSFESL